MKLVVNKNTEIAAIRDRDYKHNQEISEKYQLSMSDSTPGLLPMRSRNDGSPRNEADTPGQTGSSEALLLQKSEEIEDRLPMMMANSKSKECDVSSKQVGKITSRPFKSKLKQPTPIAHAPPPKESNSQVLQNECKNNFIIFEDTFNQNSLNYDQIAKESESIEETTRDLPTLDP